MLRFSFPAEMTKRKKHPDEDVVTQMSALGLAKPLADDDLQKMITKKTASRYETCFASMRVSQTCNLFDS